MKVQAVIKQFRRHRRIALPFGPVGQRVPLRVRARRRATRVARYVTGRAHTPRRQARESIIRRHTRHQRLLGTATRRHRRAMARRAGRAVARVGGRAALAAGGVTAAAYIARRGARALRGRPTQTGPGGAKGWWVTVRGRKVFIRQRASRRR